MCGQYSANCVEIVENDLKRRRSMIPKIAVSVVESAAAAIGIFVKDRSLAFRLARRALLLFFSLGAFFFLASAAVIVFTMLGGILPRWLIYIFFNTRVPQGNAAWWKMGLGIVTGSVSAVLAFFTMRVL